MSLRTFWRCRRCVVNLQQQFNGDVKEAILNDKSQIKTQNYRPAHIACYYLSID